MFARGIIRRGGFLACLLLCFQQTAVAQTPAVLPNRRYTLVRFTDAAGGLAAEYTVRVPENARASLRVTDLGCPGERYAVAEGGSVLFQTRRVPANASCDEPLGLSQAAEAYSGRKYSAGQVSLPPGDHAIRVTRLGTASGDAAIGVFIKRIIPTAVAPPTETTQDVSTAVTEGEDGVVTVTATGYATLLTTLTVPLTTDDGNTVTTTVANATNTVVSVVDSAVIVTETAMPSYTVVTVLSTVTSQETLTSETVVEGTTITVTEVVTLTQEVEGSTTVTLPAVTTTREETITVVATSTAPVTATASPEGSTQYVTSYITTTRGHQTGERPTGSEECTVPVVTSVVDFTSTDTVVIFTTAVPELTTTATETSTVEIATETVNLTGGSSADEGETGSTPADQTSPPPGESETVAPTPDAFSSVVSDTSAVAASSPSTRRRRPHRTGPPPRATAVSAADATPTGPGETGPAGSKLKRRGGLWARAVVDDPLAGHASVVVTVVAATPTVTVTVSEICLPSTTLTSTVLPPTATPSEEPASSEEGSSSSGEASATTQEPTTATTDEGPTPTPTPTRRPRVCGWRKAGFTLVTDRLTFPQAGEACRALGGELAEIRRFNPAAEAIDLLRLCNATRAWIEPASINTITKPQCFVLARNHWYEPADCLTGIRPVLCAMAGQDVRSTTTVL